MDGNKFEILNTTNDPVQLRHAKNQGEEVFVGIIFWFLQKTGQVKFKTLVYK